MSYDFNIKLKKAQDRLSLETLINGLPYVENSRLKFRDTHYMEIDLEPAEDGSGNIDMISFHIPYSFWEKTQIDFDLYYETMENISDVVKASVYDLQQDLYIDNIIFAAKRKRLIQTAVALGQLTYENGLLHIQYTFDPKILTWDLRDCTFKGASVAAVANPNTYDTSAQEGSLIVSADHENKAIQLSDANTGAALGSISKAGEVGHLKFISANQLLSSSRNKSIKLWDTQTLKCLKTFKGHLDYITDIKLLNPKLLVSASIGGSLIFWDMETAECIVTVLHSHYNTSWIVVAPNGDYDQSINYKGTIQWDFGKQSYAPNIGRGLDTKGSWHYTLIPDTNGPQVEGLLAKLLAPYL